MPERRGAATGRAGGGYGDRSGGGERRGGLLGSRRDTTEKGEKIIYFTQLNFDEQANDFIMTKAVIVSGVLIALFGAATFIFDLGINCIIGFAIALLFWGGYFFKSVFMRPRLPYMSYKEKKNYWTFELTEEYKQRNVVLNDFKREVGTKLITPRDKVLIDDVSVELMSYDPLIFDFAIRAAIQKQQIERAVPGWGSLFSCEAGTLVSTGINTWRVVYPRHGKWETLAGKKIGPEDAVGDVQDPSIGYNPIGIRTDNFAEMHITNVDQHTIITGDSGYGKSNTFNLILSNQFPSNALILFFDMKKLEAPAVNDRCFSVISYEQAEAWSASIMEEMNRRAQILSKAGKAKILPASEAESDSDAMPFTDEMPPIILAVDECGMWVSSSGGMQATKFRKFIEEVSRLGRATGITLICGSQSPRDVDIPDMVKRNATQYIAYKQNAETQAYALYGGQHQMQPSEAAPADIPQREPGGGGGVGQFAFASSTTDGGAVPVKAYFTSKDKVIKSAHDNKTKKKENLRIVQRASARYEQIRQEYAKKNGSANDLPVSLADPTILGHDQ